MQQFLCCGWNLSVILSKPSKYSLIKRLVRRNYFEGHCERAHLSHYCMTSISEFWWVIWHIIPADWMLWLLSLWCKHQKAQGSCKCILAAIETLSHWSGRWIATAPSIDDNVSSGRDFYAPNTNIWEMRQKHFAVHHGNSGMDGEYNDREACEICMHGCYWVRMTLHSNY